MASLASAGGSVPCAKPATKKYGAMKKNPRLAAARASVTVFNSTSSLYVNETLSQPNNKTTIRSVAEAVIQRMEISTQTLAKGEANGSAVGAAQTASIGAAAAAAGAGPAGAQRHSYKV